MPPCAWHVHVDVDLSNGRGGLYTLPNEVGHYGRGRTAGATVDNEDGPDVSRNPVSEIGDVSRRRLRVGLVPSSGCVRCCLIV